MTLDQILTALVYIGAVTVLFVLGKWLYDRLHPRFKLAKELVEKDNLAMAVAMAGYFLGLVFAIGGVLIGPSHGIIDDLIDIFYFGIAAILLLNLSGFINDKLLLYKFDNVKEIIDDQNVGTGVIEAANHTAMGLIIAGAISGQGGSMITAAAFWLLGQVSLIVGTFLYDLITPFKLHDEIEKDNVAVGVAFAGILIALGNIARIAVSGDFYSWEENLTEFGVYMGLGLLILPVLRVICDRVLLPGASLTDELVNQEKPNVGAGIIEATTYICASMLVGWCL